jgi:hypothetical protein
VHVVSTPTSEPRQGAGSAFIYGALVVATLAVAGFIGWFYLSAPRADSVDPGAPETGTRSDENAAESTSRAEAPGPRVETAEEALASTADPHEANPLDTCLALSDASAAIACIWSSAWAETAEQVAAAICLERERRPAVAAAVLGATVREFSVLDVREFVDRVLGLCPGMAYPGDLVHAALVQLEQKRSGLVAELCSTLEPAWVLGAGDDRTWTRVIGKLARDGDPAAAQFLGQIATGVLPCRRHQYDEALLQFSLLGRPAEELLDTVAAALDSATLEQHPDAVGMVVLVLLEPKSWPGGDSSPALAQISRCLHDPRFALGAAVQVLSNNSASGPPGVDATLWAAVWSRATDLARANGVQGAGVGD